MDNLKIYLGINTLTNQKIYWEPNKEYNPHMFLVGGSGSGKTETIKSIIFELKKQNMNSLIIDFHDDFKQFSDNLINLEESNVGLHPLEILPNEKPKDVAYKISQILKNIFKLGEIQHANVRKAIMDFYILSGIKNLNEKIDKIIKLIDFIKLKDCILNLNATSNELNKLLSKLSIVFDTELFNNSFNSVSFKNMISKTTVLSLNEYPTDEIKALIAEIILRKLINYLYISGKSDKTNLFCIIDEAHRLTYDGSPIDQMLRESRKYGLGMILATQTSTDFTDIIIANTSTKLAFKSNLDKDASKLAQIYQIDKSKFKNLLNPGLGYSLFNSDNKSKKLQIVQAKKRDGYTKLIKHFDEHVNKEYYNAKIKIEKEKEDKLNKLKIDNKEYINKLTFLDKKIKQKDKKISDLEYNLNNTTNKLEETKTVLKELKIGCNKLEKGNSEKSKQIIDLKYNLNNTTNNFNNYIKHIFYLLNNEKKTKYVLDNLDEKEKINLDKKNKICKNCFAFISKNDQYCPICGVKI